MRNVRYLTVCASVLFVAASVHAQFEGPAPMAWRWTQPTSVAPSGSPVIVDEMAFVAVGNRIFGLDRTSGNQKWKYPNVDPIPGNFRYGIQHGEGSVVAAADNKVIYAVDSKTGLAKWQYLSAVPFQGSPVVVGKFLVVGLNDNSLIALNMDNGQQAWQNPYRISTGLVGALATNGNNVYYMTGANDLVALSVLNQRISWQKRFTSSSPDSTPVIYGDYLYMNAGQYVACFSATTGSSKWQQNVGEQLIFSPAVTANGAMVVTRDGRARTFDAMSGRPLNRAAVELGSVPVTTPSGSGKMFLAPCTNGALNLIDSATGAVVWSYLVRPIGGTMTQTAAAGGTGAGGANRDIKIVAIPASGPAVFVGATLYVLTSDGSLCAFDKQLGVDLTGPSVKMLWPSPGEQVSGLPPLELIFKIDDEATGVDTKTLSISANGQELDFEFGRDGFAVISFSRVGKNQPMMDGRKSIKVTVSDWLGNKTVSEFGLMIDNTLRPLSRPNINTTGPGGGVGGGRGGGGLGGG
jgi:outer membrane protein assembly factor BamB